MTIGTLSLDDRSSQAIKSLDSWELGAVKVIKTNDRAIRDGGYGASDAAQALIKRHIADHVTLVADHIEQSSKGKQADGIRDLVSVVQDLPHELIALVALQTGLHYVAIEEDLQATCIALGTALEEELWASGLRSKDAKMAKTIEKMGRRRGSMEQRRKRIKELAAESGYSNGPWDTKQRTIAGKWLCEVLLGGALFELVPYEDGRESHLTITEEAETYAAEFSKYLLENHPVPLPLLEAPKPWTNITTKLTSAGREYTVPIMRTSTNNLSIQYLKAAHKEGKLDRVYAAMNAIQSVAWSINEPIRDAIRWAFQAGLEVSGMPTKANLVVEDVLTKAGLPAHLSDEEYEALSDEAKRLRRRYISKTKEKNRSLASERQMLERDLAIADIIEEKGNKFWTAYNMDWRGRVYSVSYFGFQRQDHVRAMFTFAEGKPLGATGLYWLKVHLANCADVKVPWSDKKTSKLPFAERVQWVDNNIDIIKAIAMNYKKNVRDTKATLQWTKVDQPFLFLAAAIELHRALTHTNPCEYRCSIPVSFDGSCSGLQHLSAMTRDEHMAALVNLTPTDVVSDVYQAVAEEAKAAIEAVAASESEHVHLARLALDHGVDRSLVKRNVMTYGYSSPIAGMQAQQKADTMRPLADKVLKGELQAHPFEVPEDTFEDKKGRLITVPGNTAANFLGALVYRTIEKVAVRPAAAMKFLQNIAGTMAHESKATVWHTPLGLPVVLHVPQMEEDQVRLYMANKGVKTRVRSTILTPTTKVDKRKSKSKIASCFVHSMDACHLQMVSLKAAEEGITNMALVHDSFGCMPGDADHYREIIKGEFSLMYDTHDVLAEIREVAESSLETNADKLEPLPEKGSLDIKEVLNAEYAFA